MTRRRWIQFPTSHDHVHDARVTTFTQAGLAHLVTDASDGVWLLEDDEVAPGIRTGCSENLYESQETVNDVRRIAEHAIPLYEPTVFDRYEQGVVAPLPGVSR